MAKEVNAMIDFQPLIPGDRQRWETYLLDGAERGCEYSYTNLCLWGRQKVAEVAGHMVLFSQFNRRSVYPYPVGAGPKGPVLEAIMDDARQRGIPCRITGLNRQNIELMEQLFPGRFRFHCDRDSYDYVYAVEDLAELKGRKYQKKRNHVNRFRQSCPDHRQEPLSRGNVDAVRAFADRWYAQRLREDPHGDYHMERAALSRALSSLEELELEGLTLWEGDRLLAFTLGSPLSPDTFDIHFEKALPEVEGAYAAINQAFARWLRQTHPDLRYLNREDDLGMEGLRKAKLSYYPHHLTEKCWACLLEDGYDY